MSRGAADANSNNDAIAKDNSTVYQAGQNIYFSMVSATATRTISTLPADTAFFAGRKFELDTLREAIQQGTGKSRVVAIFSIDGMPGIGKTALAVHASHLLASYFPEGQLFVDLNAHTAGQEPTDPAQALAALLSLEDDNKKEFPAGLEERAQLWRSHVAGRRFILVLDNAATTEQVKPLLPGTAGSLVLITSRRHLADLHATSLPLDTLPFDEARRMLLNISQRQNMEEAAVDDLVSLSGRLPLAIALLGALLNKHRSWLPRDLVTDTRNSLVNARAENKSIAAAFYLSYRTLDNEMQQLFRAISLHPGSDVDAWTASTLAGVSVDYARSALDDLCSDHLITEPLYRRYRMHDLMREYARLLGQADPQARKSNAIKRLFAYYERALAVVNSALSVDSPTPPPELNLDLPQLGDLTAAMSWLGDERSNLRACLEFAIRNEMHEQVVRLTAASAGFLRYVNSWDRPSGQWNGAIDLHSAAISAAQQLSDQGAEANALYQRGALQRLAGEVGSAMQSLESALVIFQQIGDKTGQGDALVELGFVYHLTGRYQLAVQSFERAILLYANVGERTRKARALAELGNAKRLTGDYAGAIEAVNDALEIFVEVDDQRGQAQARNIRGLVNWLMRKYGTAAADIESAHAIFSAIRDAHGEARSLHYLGMVLWLSDSYSKATESLRGALEIQRNLGDRHGQANSMNAIGLVNRSTGDLSAATTAFSEALGIFQSIENRHGEGNALLGLGSLRRLRGDLVGAQQILGRAESIFDQIGNRLGLAETLTESGAVHHAASEFLLAAEKFAHALEIYQEIRDPWGEADVTNNLGQLENDLGKKEAALGLYRHGLDLLEGLETRALKARIQMNMGTCLAKAGRRDEGVAWLREAKRTFQEIGAMEAWDIGRALDEASA